MTTGPCREDLELGFFALEDDADIGGASAKCDRQTTTVAPFGKLSRFFRRLHNPDQATGKVQSEWTSDTSKSLVVVHMLWKTWKSMRLPCRPH